MNRINVCASGLLSMIILVMALSASAAEKMPVYVGLDAEFGYTASTSAESIREGVQIAVEEINKAGGVLGGRPLAIEERSNHSVPARSIENIKELAAKKDLVAVFGGRFSPTILESLPTIHSEKMILLDAWGAADSIVKNGYKPNYVFRLSLVDSWAMSVMLKHAQQKGIKKVGLLLLNTSWGRSNLKSAEQYVAADKSLKIVSTNWFNWNDKTFADKYLDLKSAGAEAIILVANANEAIILLKEMAAMQPKDRLPIISHWGVTGGLLAETAGTELKQLDFSVVQTYSFINAKRSQAKQVVAAHNRLFKTKGARDIKSPVGVAHGYDLTHLLAKAINKAGSTDRPAIRTALEQLGPYKGLIKDYPQPFTSSRHEGLAREDVFMARYDDDGAIVRISTLGKKR